MKKKTELEKVEKLDARIKKEIQDFKTEVMKLTEKLDVRIKNEIQNFKNEIEKGIEEEIVDEPGTVCLLHLEIPTNVSTTSDRVFHTYLMKRLQKYAKKFKNEPYLRAEPDRVIQRSQLVRLAFFSHKGIQ